MPYIPGLTFSLFFIQVTGFLALLAYVCVAVAIALIGLGARRVLTRKVFPTLIAFAEKKKLEVVEIILKGFAKPTAIGVWVISLFIAIGTLPWTGVFGITLTGLVMVGIRVTIIMILALGFWNSGEICNLLLRGATSHFEMDESKTIGAILVKVYRAIVAIFTVIIVMGEFNFEITGMIASLSIVGLALSLAAQDSASNLFAGLMILIERPFNIGDWISVTGTEGIVEDITLRSTKIRALDNSLYVLPNASVCGATINNGTNREMRMYRFTLGVTYTTTRAQLEQLMADIEAMLNAHEHVVEDSVIVRLAGFGDSSIDILISCYADIVDLPTFLGLQNELNLNIMDVMAANNTSFAFPSTSVYMEKTEK